MTDSYFCSQDCFKNSWVCSRPASYQSHILTITQSEHKKLHKSSNPLRNLFAPNVVSKPDPVTGTFNPFPTYKFAGPLRPVYPLSETRKIPAHIPKPDYARDGIPRSEQVAGRQRIKILNEAEIAGMRKVCKLAREVLDIAAAAAVPGVTTDYIDEIVHKACIERNVRPHSFTGFKEKLQVLIITVLPLPSKLLPLPKIRLHLPQRKDRKSVV